LESKAKEIKEIKDIIKNNKNNYEQYIRDFDFEKAKKMHLRFPLIRTIFDNSREKKMDKAIETWDKYEDMIKRSAFNKMNKTLKNKLIEYFNDENNKERLVEIFGNAIYEHFKNINNIISKEKKKLNEDILNNLKIVLKYYENYFFESQKEEIKFLSEAIKKGEEFKYNKYLENVEEKKVMNDKYPLIEAIFISNNKEKPKTEKEIQNFLNSSYKIVEKAIKDKKTAKLKPYIKDALKEFFSKKENHQILIKIFSQDMIDSFSKQDIKKISEENINKLNIILEYYNNFYSEEKAKEINEIKEIIKNNKNNYEQYIKDFEKAKKMNIRFPLIDIMFKYSREKTMDKAIGAWEKYEDMINRGKFVKMNKTLKSKLIEYFNDEKNKDILIEIFGNNIYENFKNAGQISKKNKKLSEDVINNLKIVLKYYQNYLFEENKEDIISLEKVIKGDVMDCNKYLENLEIAKIKNKEFPIIEYLLNYSESNNKQVIRTQTKIKKEEDRFESFKKCVEDGIINKMNKPVQKAMLAYFQNEENKEILLKLFTQEKINWFLGTAKTNMQKKSNKEILNNLNDVLYYYKNYNFESKKEEIIFLENAIKKEDEFDYKKYLQNFEKIRYSNNRFPIVEYLCSKNNKDNKKKLEEKEIRNALEKFKKLELAIKARKAEEILEYLEEDNNFSLFEFFKNSKNEDKLLRIFNREDIKFFLKKEEIDEENISKLEEIKKYYENYLFEKKLDDLNSLKEIIKSKKGKFIKYLKDLEKARYMNLRYPLIKCLIDEKNKKNENNLNEAIQNWEIIEHIIIEKKSIQKLKHRKIIINILKEDNNKKILSKIFEKEVLDEFNRKVKEDEDKENTNTILRKLKSVLKYYKEYHSQTKKEEINLLENKIKRRIITNNEIFLKDYEESKRMKKKSLILNYLNKSQSKSEVIISNNIGFLEDFDNLLKDKKTKKIKKHHKNLMLNYMDSEEKGETPFQYFSQEQRDMFRKKF